MASTGDNGSADRFALVGTELERKFKIERVVAEGGFGVVYEGRHLGLDAPVAIKVLKTPPDLNDAARREFIAKFSFEAKTIARIKHPNIVHVLDTGVSEMPSGVTAPWMVLEWLVGQTLEENLAARRGRGGRPPIEAYGLLQPIVAALAYAHDEGVAHRDLKPGNVMLVQMKRGFSIRLLDFGIAKLMTPGESAGSGFTATQTSLNAFSPNYAAPEQIGAARTGPWTDVHALGLLFTELLTDQAPYGSEDLTELFQQVLSPVRPTPRKLGVDVGPLEHVIRKAVAFKSDERFRDAHEFMAAIEEIVPVIAPGSVTGNYPALSNASGPQRALHASIVPATPSESAATLPADASGGRPPTTLTAATIATGIDDSEFPAGLRPTRHRGAIIASVVAAGGVVLAAFLFVAFNRPAETRTDSDRRNAAAPGQRSDSPDTTPSTRLPTTVLAPLPLVPDPTVTEPGSQPTEPTRPAHGVTIAVRAPVTAVASTGAPARTRVQRPNVGGSGRVRVQNGHPAAAATRGAGGPPEAYALE